MQAPPRPLPALWRELQATLPIVSLLPMLRRPDASRTIGINAVIGAAIAGLAAMLIAATGSWAQWSALGLGAYCVASWMQNIALRDPATFAMVLKCRTLVFTNLGTAFYIFVIAGIGGWIVPFMIRVHGASAAEAGAVIGIFTALCGVIANVGGGVISDFLEKHTKRARAYVLVGSLVLTLPLIVSMLYAPSKTEAYLLFGLFFLTATVWFGVGPSVVNSLVMPRMRGITTALYFIVVTLLGVALGPYVMGYVSDLFIAGGSSPGEALRQGILSGVIMLAPAAGLLALAAVYLPYDEATRLERARALGEPV